MKLRIKRNNITFDMMLMHTSQLPYNSDKGWIELICGSMFSGKTEELLRRVRRAKHANIKCGLFKPLMDDRYGVERIQTHDGSFEKGIPVKVARDILNYTDQFQLIAVDEVQFLDEGIIEVSQQLADLHKIVILAGLDLDANRRPFGSMPTLMAQAEYLSKLHAVCSNCGSLAGFTHRHSQGEHIQLGAKEHYNSLCRPCYNQRNKK